MKKWTNTLAPGRMDSAVAILIVTGVLAAVVGVVPSVDRAALYMAPQSVLIAIAIGFTVASFAAVDLWLMFGGPRLMRRWLQGLIVGGIPCAGLVIGYFYGLGRAAGSGSFFYRVGVPSLVELTFALITFRLAVACCLGTPSIYLRTLTGWRIADSKGELSQRSMFQISIGDLMLLTANVALTLVSLRVVWAIMRARGPQTVQALGLAGGVELAFLLVFILLPLAVDLRLPAHERKLPLLLPIGTAVLGAVAGLAFFFLRYRSPHAEAIAMSIFWACFSFGIASFFWWRAAERAGLGWTRGVSDAEHALPHGVPKISTPTVNPRFVSLFVLLLLGLALFCYQHDVFAMFNGQSRSAAHRVASVSRLFGALPERDGFLYRWKSKSGSAEVEYTTGRFQFDSKDRLSPKLLARAIPQRRPVRLRIETGFIGEDVLDVLSSRSLDSLEIDCEAMDPGAFDTFCRTTDVQSLAIRCDNVTPRHVRSLHHIGRLRDLTFPVPRQGRSADVLTPIVYSPDMRDALRGLPISRESPLSLQFPGHHTDLTQFKGLHGLMVVNSRLTPQICEQLGNEDLFVGRDEDSGPRLRSRSYLWLVDCPLSKTAIKGVRLIKLPRISWSFSMEGSDASESDLLELAEIPNLVELDVRDRQLDEIFVNRFQVRRGNAPPPCTIRSGYLVYDYRMYKDNVDHLEYLLAKHEGDLDQALSELAHSIVRDESGEIQELDLQWMRITPTGLTRLRQLRGLRRLRTGHSLQNAEFFESVAKLRSLRVLEIPTPCITDAGLAQISKLRDLTRLQLPLYRNDKACPHPEQIPFPRVMTDHDGFFPLDESHRTDSVIGPDYLKRLLAHRAVLIGEMHDGHYYATLAIGRINLDEVVPDSRLTERGIAHLAALEELEYLFMPGFLLSHTTMDTLESLPRLRQLHALFSHVSPALLRRLSALDLESLSVGVGDVDGVTTRLLGNMPRLSTLQLFVFNTVYTEDERKRDRAAAELRAALPKCEVHVQFLPSL